ncbi:MAG: TerB family tellurite resistance protein [Gemmatimonadetes bacterium]|nr:TerB family tellurite resistance protein [Gemmatimonadota bacterium]
MRDRIREFFEQQMSLQAEGNGGAAEGRGGLSESSGIPAADPGLRRVHIAACALLLELAHADDEFSEAERMHIEAVLRRHFELDEATALELMELAEVERAAPGGLQKFTRLIREGYDRGQKTLLAEIMWGVILSDGEIARHEAYMLRQITTLLDLEAGYLSDLRKPPAEGQE